MLEAYLNPRVLKPTKAVWSIISKKNKKWCRTGAFIYRGMRGIPVEISYKIEELKNELGEPPDDLDWGFRLSSWRFFLVKLRGFFWFWYGVVYVNTLFGLNL